MKEKPCNAEAEDMYAPRWADMYGYANGYVECVLPEGHEGDHRYVYEWSQ